MATPSEIRAFVERDWRRAQAFKREYWLARTAAERLEVVGGLWLHARDHIADWPNCERDADLRHHRELNRRLGRVAHAFSRR